LLTLVLVALGGAVGAVLRWWVGDLVPDRAGFPWTTFAINVSGCLALALLPALAVVRNRPAVAAALGPGLLGGYTTMSAYAEETRALLADDRLGTAAAYVVGTVTACLVVVVVAERLTRRMPTAPVVEP
jgi:fluoride exporter